MKAIKIAYFGDSITWGEGHYPGKGVPLEKRWTTLADTALVAEYPFIYSRNFGVNGNTTRDGLERLPALYSFHPDVMTLQFGVNDCNCWLSDGGYPRVNVKSFEYNLIEFINKARANGTSAIILSTNPVCPVKKPLLNGESLGDHTDEYNRVIRNVAPKMGTPLCDIAAGFTMDTTLFLKENGKWIHLSEKGNSRYASLILPFLQSALEKI
jgi:lysophospholipase L1-like esterase